MLVVCSDLHLTDGSTSKNVAGEVFEEILLHEILVNADENGAKEIRIVLLGDIFDFVRTDYWLRENIPLDQRPWGGELDAKTGMNRNTADLEKQFNHILDEILKTRSSQSFLEMINKVARETGKYTKLTYIVGNHDRVFWNFPSLQDKVRRLLSDVTQNGQHPDRVEFLTVLDAPEYGVLGRHGHEWDEHNHGWEFHNEVLNKKNPVGRFDHEAYKIISIGEVVTAELMGGFIYRVKKNVAAPDKELVERLMSVNNVRPMTDVFRWLDWFGSDSFTDNNKKIILAALKESLKAVLSTPVAKQWDRIKIDLLVKGDLVDRFQLLEKALRNAKYEDIKQSIGIFEMVGAVLGGSRDRYTESAEKEWDWMSGTDLRDIQYILYGHTHKALHEYFAGTPDGRVRMYINTGTYLPLIEKTSNKKGFYSAYQMTMAFFYRKDEDRQGRTKDQSPTMDLWNGIKRKIYQ
jgi:UDP-2,3-diacylglucosamine pyrophosphatase LpxH